MVSEEQVRKCVELANQFKGECSSVIEEAKGPCTYYFIGFVSSFMRMNQGASECFLTFNNALKEKDEIKRREMLGRARLFCVRAIDAGNEALSMLIDLEKNLCVLAGVEGFRTKINEEIKNAEEISKNIEKELMKVWKK